MKKNFAKMLAALSIAAVTAVTSINVPPVPVAAQEMAGRTIYNGTNENENTYNQWADVIKSYLAVAPDGTLMRVDGGALEGKIVIEYYDTSYKFLSQKQVDTELPKFGGFYSDGNAYYVLTGQENRQENNNTEVYCITKYDTSWNRIASCGLYGANTYIPFDAGTVRMTKNGKWLLIHTCHEMYTTEDGYNHQANVTIEVDTDSMKITDSYTDIMNINLGYVSHSFNQFILTDGNNIITLDHGDAYPRSVVLLKYPTDFTTGSFVPDYFDNPCQELDMLTIPGEEGDNYTGVTVGGFEKSSTSFIAAGTTEDDVDKYGGENVWVSVVSRGLGSPELKYITSYKKGETETSTPQLVQTGTDSFILLWCEGKKVRYAALDGSGNITGEIHTADAVLSDCKPLMTSGKLVWYVWEDDVLDFYDIDLNTYELNKTDLSKDWTAEIKPILKKNNRSRLYAWPGEITVEFYDDSDDDYDIGHQIQIRRKGTSKWKTRKNDWTSFRGLKRRAVYQVRTRAYVEISGKTYYSSWSKVKSIKTK